LSVIEAFVPSMVMSCCAAVRSAKSWIGPWSGSIVIVPLHEKVILPCEPIAATAARRAWSVQVLTMTRCVADGLAWAAATGAARTNESRTQDARVAGTRDDMWADSPSRSVLRDEAREALIEGVSSDGCGTDAQARERSRNDLCRAVDVGVGGGAAQREA